MMQPKKNRIERVEQWVASFQEAIPLRALESSEQEATIQSFLERHPILVGTNVEAMLWIRLGLIDRAHEIVQDAARGAPAYIHGMIHRLEGDYWNANYWFNRCQDSAIMSRVASIATGQGHSFSPAQFTKSVEKFCSCRQAGQFERDSSKEQNELSQLAILEWMAVWDSLGD